jgi:hypothetical protein
VEPERDKPSGWKRREAGFQAEKVRSSPSRQQGTGRPPRRCSASHALVEFVFRLRLGEGIAKASFFVEKDGLGFVLFPRRGAACRGNPRRRAWLADVPQNPLYRGRLGHEGNNPHLGPTLGAGERPRRCEPAASPAQIAGARAIQRRGGFFGATLRARRELRRCTLGCQGRDGGPQGRIRGQHTVIAVSVLARRWDQRGDALDQLQGRQDKLRAPVRTWPGQVVDQAVPIQLLDPIPSLPSALTIFL